MVTNSRDGAARHTKNDNNMQSTRKADMECGIWAVDGLVQVTQGEHDDDEEVEETNDEKMSSPSVRSCLPTDKHAHEDILSNKAPGTIVSLGCSTYSIQIIVDTQLSRKLSST